MIFSHFTFQSLLLNITEYVFVLCNVIIIRN